MSCQGGAAAPSSRDPTGFEVPYELGTSAIAGIGIFATTPLARGTLLWRADSRSQVVHTEATLRERLASLSSTEAIELLEHVYCWEGEVLEVVGDGKYWNHSRTRQNTGSGGNHPDGDGEGRGDGVSSYALRDIEAGEELLDDYALYPTIPWFEALCEAHGAQSCTSVGKRFIALQAVGEQLGVTVHWWVGWFPSKAACDAATHMYHGDCHKVLWSGNDAGWSPGVAVDLIWDGIRPAYDPRARDECNDGYRSAGRSHCEFVFEWVEGEPWIGFDPVFTTPALVHLAKLSQARWRKRVRATAKSKKQHRQSRSLRCLGELPPRV